MRKTAADKEIDVVKCDWLIQCAKELKIVDVRDFLYFPPEEEVIKRPSPDRWKKVVMGVSGASNILEKSQGNEVSCK